MAILNPTVHMRPWPAITLLLGACAPRLVLPPISPGPEWSQTDSSTLTIRPAPGNAPEIQIEFDSASGFTRRAVTTHRGVYTGWVSKPQVTFFALTPGQAPPSHLPATIGLVFRALEPQAVTGTRLILACPQHADSLGVAAVSRVVPTGNTQSHFLTYLLPLTRVATFANCDTGTLEIAQVRVQFSTAQLGGLRALLLRLGAAPRQEAT